MLNDNDVHKEYEKNHAYLVLCIAYEIITILLILHRSLYDQNINPILGIGIIKIDMPEIIFSAGLLILIIIYKLKEIIYKKTGKIPYLLSSKKLEENSLFIFLLLCLLPLMITCFATAFKKLFF